MRGSLERLGSRVPPRTAASFAGLTLLAVACAAPSTPSGVSVPSEPGVRVPVDEGFGANGLDGADYGAIPGLDPAMDAPGAAGPGGRRAGGGSGPGSTAVCTKRGIIDTGPIVDFPWAPACAQAGGHGNGGDTARGVTVDTIRVAYYLTKDPAITGAMKAAGGCGETSCHRDYVLAYLDWFSSYFESFGRRIEVVFVEGSGPERDESAAKADARRIAGLDPPVFAALSGPQEAGGAYAAELAANGILCFCTVSLPQDYYERHDPYVWSWLMSSTQAYLHRADYIGGRLAGRKAVHAGTSELRGRTRSFGLVWFDNDRGDYASGVEFFEQRLAGYGVALKKKIRYTNIEGCQINATNIAVQLASAEVTSVIFAGDPICPISLTKAAQTQRARWEWIITGSVLTDTNNFGRLYDQSQWSRAFGVSMLAPKVRDENTFWFKMYREIRPGKAAKVDALIMLEPMVPFFTGVHLAGPALTPQTFRLGLASAAPTGGTVTVPRRSYGSKVVDGIAFWDTTSYDDMTEIWWDPDATDPNGDSGAYRYVDGGRRYVWGEWPRSAPKVFTRAGAITGYDDPPDQ